MASAETRKSTLLGSLHSGRPHSELDRRIMFQSDKTSANIRCPYILAIQIIPEMLWKCRRSSDMSVDGAWQKSRQGASNKRRKGRQGRVV